jgi:drug/metabolite transporter (DMT)-like permease
MAEIEMADKTKAEEIAEDLKEIEKELESEKETSNILGEDSDLQQEKKTYINFICCQLSVGIISTYTYIAISILMNVVNRVIFHTYKFRFNFTILFFQQFFCLLTFIILSMKSSTYRNQVGEISLNDFKKLQKNYIIFSLVFILNNIIGFVGSQKVKNTAMYLTLRKLFLVMIYFYDLFIGKKRISLFTSICILLITFGSVLAGIEDFSQEYLGYVIVLMYNSSTILYNKLTENFKKDTGVPNLKLLVYNSFLSCPILFILLILNGEVRNIFVYLTGEKLFEGSYFGLFVNLMMSFGFCVALILSFFISNEKNSSLFTAMLSNCKDIAITALSYFWVEGTKFTFFIVTGLFISTTGAVLISIKSMLDNMKKKEKKEYLPIQIENEKQ